MIVSIPIISVSPYIHLVQDRPDNSTARVLNHPASSAQGRTRSHFAFHDHDDAVHYAGEYGCVGDRQYGGRVDEDVIKILPQPLDQGFHFQRAQQFGRIGGDGATGQHR